MPTTDQGLPYPDGTGLVMAGNDDIEALAEAVAPKKLRAVKAAGTSRTATAAYADDPDLVLNVPAAGKYLFRAFISATAKITHGIKVQVVATGAGITGGGLTTAGGMVIAYGRVYGVRVDTGASVVAADVRVHTQLETGGGNPQLANAATVVLANTPAAESLYLIELSGVVVATAAGDIKVQWAQNVSGANAASLGAGSAMYLEKVA